MMRAVVLLFCSLVAAKSSASVEALRQVYPDGRIYLTYLPLAGLRSCLNDPEKAPTLSAAHPNGTRRMKEFLRNYFREEMNSSVAFLQIDFVKNESGYKLASDRGGRANRLIWSPAHVLEVAELAHAFLDAADSFERTLGELRTRSLADAWVLRSAPRGNAYVPRERMSELMAEMRSLVDSREDELSALADADHPTASEIEDFADDFDVDDLDTPTPFQIDPRVMDRLDRYVRPAIDP